MPSGKPEPDAPDADAAEAAAAEAEARAEAARTRANELRRKLEAASADDTAEADEAAADDVDEVAEADAEPAVEPTRSCRPRSDACAFPASRRWPPAWWSW